jgi:hypothetical protein
MGSFLHKFLHTDCKDNIQWFSFSAAEVSAQRVVDSMKGLFNSTVLRFTRSKTSNGPDVHVYLFATDDARDSESVKRAAFVDLGSIKGNIGDQNYTLGSDVDLSKYRTVSVWCKRFSVNFGAAPLTTDRVAQR